MDREVARRKATLEIDARADPIVGTITGDDGLERPFSGWMELAGAIEAWRTENRSGSDVHTSPATSRDPPRQ